MNSKLLYDKSMPKLWGRYWNMYMYYLWRKISFKVCQWSMMKCVRWFWWSYPLTICKQMQKGLTLIWTRIRQHLWNSTLIIDTYLSLVVSIGKKVWYLVKLGAICLWIRTCIVIIFVYLPFVTQNCKCCFNKRGIEFTSLSEIAD